VGKEESGRKILLGDNLGGFLGHVVTDSGVGGLILDRLSFVYRVGHV
jgi:hypothetical protein